MKGIATSAAMFGLLVAFLAACSAGQDTPHGSISATATPGPVASADIGFQIPADTLAQLAKAPPGTVIVPCSSSEPLRPDGTTYSINPVWAMRHPAFRQLVHGYCADDPSATPLPDSDVVSVVPAP